jgi:hypothetical protein
LIFAKNHQNVATYPLEKREKAAFLPKGIFFL